MSSYIPLRHGLADLAQSISAERESSFEVTPLAPVLPPIPPSELTPRVKAVWGSCQGDQGSSNGSRVEVVRSVLDLVGRDLVVSPIVNGDVSSFIRPF